MRWQWSGMLVLMTTACLAPRTDPTLVPVGPHAWLWQNSDLTVRLEIDAEDRFVWRFENRTLLPVAIDPSGSRLEDAGGATFTLWGQPWREEQLFPPIEVRGGGFTTLAYPIQFASPARGLPLARGWTLVLETRWGKNAETYRLRFPAPKADARAE